MFKKLMFCCRIAASSGKLQKQKLVVLACCLRRVGHWAEALLQWHLMLRLQHRGAVLQSRGSVQVLLGIRVDRPS